MEGDRIMQKKERHESPYRRFLENTGAAIDNDSNWLITLSDLLTLLLMFFIFFFLTAGKPGAQKTESKAGDAVPPTTRTMPAPPSEQEKVRDEMASAIRDMDMDDAVSVRSSKGEVIITLREKVTFRPGEADLLDTSRPVLDKIGGLLHRYPSFMVEIDGHTDDQPINTRQYPSNWELSVDRATKVLKYLVAKGGMEPSRCYVQGNADLRPLVPNDTPEQRAENRRVEIRLKQAVAPESRQT